MSSIFETNDEYNSLSIIPACLADNISVKNSTFTANYNWLAPQQICFGWGRRSEVGQLAASLGNRAFIVSGSRTLERNGTIDELEHSLKDAGVAPVHLGKIHREPEVEDVDQLVGQLRQLAPVATDLVIGMGGGAALDLAKAASALATNNESDTVKDYLEGVGKGCQIKHDPLPMLAIPTTSGTGSEATKNAVISSYDPPFKKSLRSDKMVPRVVLVDPELTIPLPAKQTAESGMDAITQLIESYLSCRSKPLTEALCLQGIPLAFESILSCVKDGTDRVAREKMAHAALLSGMALANSGLGMAHGVAASLGVNCRIPHGLACAVMLPVTLKTNQKCSLTRMGNLGRLIHGNETLSDEAAAEALIQDVENLNQQTGIPTRLSELGVTSTQIPAIVRNSGGNSMNGNPREIKEEELTRILESIL